jgi:hypothetical protein
MIATIKNKFALDATQLKLIACALMVCDHIHQMFSSAEHPMWWLTYLGRLVFPIFLFLMADSFHYTRSRKKLILRLLYGSWFMNLGNYIFGVVLFPPTGGEIILINNVFSTFVIVTLYMLFWDMLVKGIKEKNVKRVIAAVLLCFVPVLTMLPLVLAISFAGAGEAPAWVAWFVRIYSFVPNIMFVEGGPRYIALGVLLYIFRRRRWAQFAVLAAFSVWFFVSAYSTLGIFDYQCLMIVAIIPLFFYNDQKGKGMKEFFYVFYPAHIYVLFTLSMLLR